MILYFSATGNCEFIAKRVASKTNDKAYSITEITETVSLNDGESLGFVIPTYYWGLPSIVEDFVKNFNLSANNPYIYLIVTYGSTSGQADYFFNKLLKKKGYALSASFGIKTVDNYTIDYNVNNKEEIKKTLTKERLQTDAVIEDIKAKRSGFIKKDKKAVWLCKCAKHYYNKDRRTKFFAISDACIGCGLCEKNCPTKTIKLSDGKPIFTKERCAMCFACIHRCEMGAVSYANKTGDNGQYVHPKEYEDEE